MIKQFFMFCYSPFFFLASDDSCGRRDLFAGIDFASVGYGSLAKAGATVFGGNEASMVVTTVSATSSITSCGGVPAKIKRKVCQILFTVLQR
ncbi:hypothetical protein Tco_1556764 [Tanacetum coccineum]